MVLITALKNVIYLIVRVADGHNGLHGLTAVFPAAWESNLETGLTLVNFVKKYLKLKKNEIRNLFKQNISSFVCIQNAIFLD